MFIEIDTRLTQTIQPLLPSYPLQQLHEAEEMGRKLIEVMESLIKNSISCKENLKILHRN